MKRRIRYMALLLVLCMLALTGCAQPRDTMTLRVCLDAAPATLDPAMASSDAERTVVAHLFENLMKLSRGEDGSIQPVYAAAQSYTVEDNLDGTETILRYSQARYGIQLSTGSANRFIFDRRGRARGKDGSNADLAGSQVLTIKPQNCPAGEQSERALTITSTGQARLSRSACA